MKRRDGHIGGGGGGGGQTCSLCFIKHMIDAFQRFLYFSAFKPDLTKYNNIGYWSYQT